MNKVVKFRNSANEQTAVHSALFTHSVSVASGRIERDKLKGLLQGLGNLGIRDTKHF